MRKITRKKVKMYLNMGMHPEDNWWTHSSIQVMSLHICLAIHNRVHAPSINAIQGHILGIWGKRDKEKQMVRLLIGGDNGFISQGTITGRMKTATFAMQYGYAVPHPEGIVTMTASA